MRSRHNHKGAQKILSFFFSNQHQSLILRASKSASKGASSSWKVHLRSKVIAISEKGVLAASTVWDAWAFAIYSNIHQWLGANVLFEQAAFMRLTAQRSWYFLSARNARRRRVGAPVWYLYASSSNFTANFLCETTWSKKSFRSFYEPYCQVFSNNTITL